MHMSCNEGTQSKVVPVLHPGVIDSGMFEGNPQ